MKATIRVSEMDGFIKPEFIMEGQNSPPLPNEHVLFCITEEAQPQELASVLMQKAREEAERRGIQVHGL